LHIGVHVLETKYYDAVRNQVTAQRVKELLGNEVGEVERFELPNVCGLNFVIHDALDGGISHSLQFDRRGSFASAILDIPVDIQE
jgi:hypothetical protein